MLEIESFDEDTASELLSRANNTAESRNFPNAGSQVLSNG